MKNAIRDIVYAALHGALSALPYSIGLIAVLLAINFFLGCSDNKTTLHIYSWVDYFDPSLIEKFETENNCRVVIDTYDSNEAMYAKLKAGSTGYDIITPTSYQMHSLIAEGLVDKIDTNLVVNAYGHIDDRFSRYMYQPSVLYSVPYAIGWAGLMYDKKNVKDDEVLSWDVIGNSKFKLRTMLMADIREVIGIGLMYNGYSINTKSQSEIDKAVETILEWKKNVRKFDSESYKTDISCGSIYVGHAYSGDTAQVIIGDGEEGSGRDDIGFALPKEGFTASCDEFAIMTSSLNKELSHKFINFMYDTENARQNMEYIVTIMPKREAIEEVDERIMKILLPDDVTLERGQVIKFLDPDIQEMYNKAWDKIMATK